MMITPVDPNCIFVSIWKIVLLVITVYELMAIPIEMSFNIYTSQIFIIIQWIENILFLLDVFINFHTAFYKEGVLIKDHKQIALKYMRGWFFIDLLACIPFQTVFIYNADEFTNELFALFGLFRTFKIVRFITILRRGEALTRFRDFVRMSGELNGVMRLFKLCFVIIFLAHWVACFWHLIGFHPGARDQTSWIMVHGLEDASISARYLKSLYWAIATLLTVGYGDIVATNNSEEIFSIFVMLLGSGVVGFSMNQIGDILEQINSEVNYRE